MAGKQVASTATGSPGSDEKVEPIMIYLHRTMIVPDSIVATVRTLADSFGPASTGMWTTPLSTTGELPATHWISTGFVGDDFAAVLPFSHFVDSAWVTEPYDPAAFIALCATYDIAAPSVEQITAIMSMVDVSDQEPFAAMERLGLMLVQEPIDSGSLIITGSLK